MIVRIRPGSNPRQKAAPPSTRSSAGRSTVSILDAVADDRLFAPWFAKKPGSWAAWFAFLAALFALPMTPEQLKLYQQCTGRKKPPLAVARACYLICGRRSGKSFILALVAVFLACFFDFREFLSRGERCVTSTCRYIWSGRARIDT